MGGVGQATQGVHEGETVLADLKLKLPPRSCLNTLVAFCTFHPDMVVLTGLLVSPGMSPPLVLPWLPFISAPIPVSMKLL